MTRRPLAARCDAEVPNGVASTDEARAAQAYVREVGRAFTSFARAVHTLKLYGPSHTIVLRALGELEATFAALLAGDRALALRLRTDAFVLDDVEVLEETDTTDSIPYVFYRDGIRRLELSAGVTREELGVLVGAAAQGFLRTSFGDDVASYLWRHELEHVRWVVVDTTLSTASGAATPGASAPQVDADDAIDGLLLAIYGDPIDVGHRVTQVDVADFRGKAIADQLDDVDEMAPGFHPARGLDGGAYAGRMRAEAAEDESKIPARAALMALGAFAAAREPSDVEAVSEALLQLYDAELGSGSVRLALPIVAGVRDLAAVAALEARCAAWLEQVGSEPRLRQVTKLMGAASGEQLAPIFLAAGRAGVPTLLGLIAGLEQAEHRRLLADVVLALGVDDPRPLAALLEQPAPSAAVEAVYVLVRLGVPAALERAAQARLHPSPRVRLELLASVEAFPRATVRPIVFAALEDPEAEVVVAAARVLGSWVGDAEVAQGLEAFLAGPTFAPMGAGAKQSVLAAFVLAAQVRAVPVLARLLRDGGAVLAKRDDEETAIAAARALGFARTTGAISALEASARCLNRRVREATREALRRAGVEC